MEHDAATGTILVFLGIISKAQLTNKLLHPQIHCCGVDGYNDWAKTPFSQGKHIPDSCCKEYTVGCGLNRIPDTEETVWHLGCAAELSKIVTPKMNILVAICFGMAFLKVNVQAFIDKLTCN